MAQASEQDGSWTRHFVGEAFRACHTRRRPGAESGLAEKIISRLFGEKLLAIPDEQEVADVKEVWAASTIQVKMSGRKMITIWSQHTKEHF